MKKLLHTRQSKVLIRVKSTANIWRFHCLEVFTQQSLDSADLPSANKKNVERMRLKLPIIGKCVTSNYYDCVSKVFKYNFQYLGATFKFLKAASNSWKAMLILIAIQSLQLEFLNLEVFTK